MAGTRDPQSPPVIVLENLVKFFGRFAALRDISASFTRGRARSMAGSGIGAADNSAFV